MDDDYTQWVQDNCSLLLELSCIKKREDETVPMFHFIFIIVLDKIHPSFRRVIYWIMCLLLIPSSVLSYGV